MSSTMPSPCPPENTQPASDEASADACTETPYICRASLRLQVGNRCNTSAGPADHSDLACTQAARQLAAAADSSSAKNSARSSTMPSPCSHGSTQPASAEAFADVYTATPCSTMAAKQAYGWESPETDFCNAAPNCTTSAGPTSRSSRPAPKLPNSCLQLPTPRP